jgi:tetratricopeptide (TPR) repeat protein
MNPKNPGQAANVTQILREASEQHQNGNLPAAETLYKKALQIQKNNTDALHLLGVLELQRKNPQAGIELIKRSLAVNPKQVWTQINLANALMGMGNAGEALVGYEAAIAIKPDLVDAHFGRGNALTRLGRHEQAAQSYGKTIALKPDHVEAHRSQGAALLSLTRYEEALLCFKKAIALNPGYADAHHGQGLCSFLLGRHEDAFLSCDTAIALDPRFAEAYNTRGIVLAALNRYAEALESYDRASSLNSGYAEAYDNRGVALGNLGRHEEALDSFAKAIAIRPNYPEANYNEGLCRLRLGDFDRGWPKYEWRDKIPRAAKARQFSAPLWLGKEALAGKTILLHAEQGLGDTIQFCRYATKVSELGGTVLLEVHEPVRVLLSQLEGVAQVLATGESLPSFDYHCPLLSLPYAFNTRSDSIPARIPYLQADPQKIAAWKGKVADNGLPKVGLVWSGSPTHMNDRNRSMPLSALKLPPEAAQFVCLQKDVRESDSAALREMKFVADFSNDLHDFSETAALIANLDLVISVDTAVAHLAAAMGKQVWLMLPVHPDWRWLLQGSTSMWYPTMTLFRQQVQGDWTDAVDQIGGRLLAFAKTLR